MKAPKPIPVGDPVRFALSDVDDAVWPIITDDARKYEINYEAVDGSIIGSRPARRFLATRQGGSRWHVGVDLFCSNKDIVVACEDGVILSYYGFYETSAGEMSYALFIQHEDFVINYGEVKGNAQTEFGWKIGDSVRAGQRIARVSTTDMIHFETYIRNTGSNRRWMVGGARPNELLNPTRYLLDLAARAQGETAPAITATVSGAATPLLRHPLLAASLDLQMVASRQKSYSAKASGGARIEAVGIIQDALNILPYTDSRVALGDGNSQRGFFGKKTDTAIRRFQARAGVKVDGVIGGDTILALDQALLVHAGEALAVATPTPAVAAASGSVEPFSTPPATAGNSDGSSKTTGLQGTKTTVSATEWRIEATETLSAKRGAKDYGSKTVQHRRLWKSGVTTVEQGGYCWGSRTLPPAQLIEGYDGFPSQDGVFSGKGTYFGKYDKQDEGTGSPLWGTVQTNSSVFGCSIKRKHLLDEGLAWEDDKKILHATEKGKRALIEIFYPATRRMIRVPLVDVGPGATIPAVVDITVAATAWLQNKDENASLANIQVKCRIIA